MTEHIDPGMRFAIYTRYSSDMQNDISLEAQEFTCRQAIEERGGTVIDVFADGAKSGWSLDRDGFMALRRGAAKGKFDAIMFWKFDRLARGYEDVMAVKFLLRRDYGVKLYCVEGFSEDDDDSPHHALMEQLLATVAAYYSQNVSRDTRRGKLQRAMRGEFNGSKPPFGYALVTKGAGTRQRPAGLHVNREEAMIVRHAFKLYASGEHSDRSVADWMNTQSLVQQLRQGKKPAGKGMVRDLLQNRVYTGRVPYAETIYTTGFGKAKKTNRRRRTWYEGRHEAIISDELFDACQNVRSRFNSYNKEDATMHVYLLHDRVYCARCIINKPDNLQDELYAKTRVSWNSVQKEGYYRCLSGERGYHKCDQKSVPHSQIDEDVVYLLSNLIIPVDKRQQIELAVQHRIQEGRVHKRLEEAKEIIRRVDNPHDRGYIVSETDYTAKNKQVKLEFDSTKEESKSAAFEAADLLDNFVQHWTMCEAFDNTDEMRQHLLKNLVKQVYMYDKVVVGVMLYGEYLVKPRYHSGIFRAIESKIVT